MDLATLVFDSATALTAALTLLFSRLDARRQSSKEDFNLQQALLDLSYAMRRWRDATAITNGCVRRWLQGGIRTNQLSREVREILAAQTVEMDDAFLVVYGRNNRSKRPLRHLLSLYGPEVLNVLETAMVQRRDLLYELVAELPRLRAEEPEAFQITVTRLESTSQELEHATERLTEYILSNFPIRGTTE